MGKKARVALVTGGTRGIGAAISEGLKDAGYKVAATYRSNADQAKSFAAKSGIAVYQWDVADYEECQNGVRQIEKDLGAIDVLVNNAGVTDDSTLHKMTPEQWKRVMHVNLDSCFNMCRAIINGMRDRGFGRIINISSINALKGQFGQTNYAATKAGIRGFTKSLALENAAKGITANSIAPGYIDTEMVRAVPEKTLQHIVGNIPVGRLGTAPEIARAVVFLAAEDSGFITGETLNINGGQYMA